MSVSAETIQEVLDILSNAGFVVVKEDWWLMSVAAYSELDRVAKHYDSPEDALEALIEVMLLWGDTANEPLPSDLELFIGEL